MIKEFFANYLLHMSDVTFDMRDTRWRSTRTSAEPWRVTLVETGRQRRDRRPVSSGSRDTSATSTFLLTYGDGVADVDIAKLVEFHGARQAGDGDRRPAAGPLRGVEIAMTTSWASSRTGGPSVPGEAAGRRRLVNGGFFVLAEVHRPHPRATTRRWERNRWRACAPTASSGLPPPRVLAADGHPARPARSGGLVGLRQGPVDRLDVGRGFVS